MKRKYQIIIAKAVVFSILILTVLSLNGCKKGNTTGATDKKSLVFGFVPGPYEELFRKAIQPELEKKGYTVKIVVFYDSYTPYKALNTKEIDGMLTGHTRAMLFEAKRTNSDIYPLISVPTAPMGLYTKKLKAKNLDELKKQLKKGDVLTLCDDPTNLPRSLVFLEQTGLIKLRKDVDKSSYTEKDIVENPYGLVIKALNSGQLPRSLQDVSISAIWGSIAIDFHIFSTALALETLEQENINTIAIRKADLNSQWVKDVVSIVKSEEFKNVIENPNSQYKLFQRPDWYRKQWSNH